MHKQLVLGMVTVVLLMSAFSACGLTNDQQQASGGGMAASQRILPAEQPESTRRMQSTAPVEASTRNSSPWGVALDEQRGFVWVAETGCDPQPTCPTAFATKISKFSMADGSWIQDFSEPQQYSSPLFVVVNPRDGTIWFTQPNSDAIGELTPDETRFQQWKTARGSVPYDLIFDNNDNLWFAETGSNSIGFLNTKTHAIVETQTPTAGSQPYGITKDPKGNIWFTENGQNVARIGTFTPTTSGTISIREFPIDSTLLSRPHLITATPNGHIWFTEGFLGNITEFDPATQNVLHYKVATACRRVNNCTHTSGIAADRQGNIWFSDSLNATVGCYFPSKGIAKVQPLSDPNAHPHDGLAIQSNGTLWFTEQFGSQIKGDPVQGPSLVMWPRGTIR